MQAQERRRRSRYVVPRLERDMSRLWHWCQRLVDQPRHDVCCQRAVEQTVNPLNGDQKRSATAIMAIVFTTNHRDLRAIMRKVVRAGGIDVVVAARIGMVMIVVIAVMMLTVTVTVMPSVTVGQCHMRPPGCRPHVGMPFMMMQQDLAPADRRQKPQQGGKEQSNRKGLCGPNSHERSIATDRRSDPTSASRPGRRGNVEDLPPRRRLVPPSVMCATILLQTA